MLWFFDLDNTLHDASHRVFPAINANMNTFIAGALADAGLPADSDAINAARIGYLRRYGATLLGMVRHHQVRPADFLDAAHRFDDLPSMLRAEPGLRTLLTALPGRKVLLTNAPQRYARDVARHFKIHSHFSHHIAIEAMQVHGRLQPKPSRALLRKLLAQQGVPAHRCILVEDTLANLKAAKSLGMRTVWMTGYLGASRATAGRLLSGTEVAGVGPTPIHPSDAAKTTKRPIYVDVKVKSIRELFDCLPSLIGK